MPSLSGIHYILWYYVAQFYQYEDYERPPPPPEPSAAPVVAAAPVEEAAPEKFLPPKEFEVPAHIEVVRIYVNIDYNATFSISLLVLQYYMIYS